MKIEVFSPTIRRKEMDAVLTAMVEEKIGPGERSRLLTQIAKEQLKFDYCLALRSPAVALHLALKALDVKPGGAVILSALSPRFYLQVIEDLQLTPVFCDVTYDFPCMSRDIIEQTIAKRNQGSGEEGSGICAIILHHTLGYIPDSSSIAELGIPVIEDISLSCASWLKTERTEEKSVFFILGLEERDMLTSGGGALLFSMNKKDSSSLRNFSAIADEYCLPDINAALAIVQFKEAQRNIERRCEIVNIYLQAGLQTKHKRFIALSENDLNCYSFSLVLETGLKDVIAYAKKKEIIVENAFENSIAGAVASSGSLASSGCPVSNSLALRTVMFPLYPRLKAKDVEHISRLIMTLP